MNVTDAMVHAYSKAYDKNWDEQLRAPEDAPELGTFFAMRAGLQAALAARQPVGEPEIWVSPGQLEEHKRRPAGQGSNYLPTRLACEGNFTQPLYTAPAAQQPAQVYLDGLDRALGEAIDQRDRYHEVADDLAGHISAITGVDIGEHSSANCPWQNAIEAAEEYKPAQAVDLPYSIDADPAGIRARVADVITGTLMVGAQGHTPPPAGHWAEPFWQAARADATAQAVHLGQMPHGIRLVEIPRRNGLDPINVFVQDYELGRGRIVVTCYGQAWCGFWGAMGDRTVMQFVAACDADYVAGNMLSGRHEHVKKHERTYVERIAIEVIAEFRALIDGKAVGK
ncbi:TPA: hypothetical protein UM790_000164 [Stenotrophomonas maltophilia]|nr:hypothetical protein [Stenotrophomonas maltophilia]